MSYSKGNWKIICDVCGFEFLNNEVKKRWDGLITCADDFEHDHPQKFIRVREDGLPVPYIRQEPTEQFVQLCYANTRLARANVGTAGCMTVGETILKGYWE